MRAVPTLSATRRRHCRTRCRVSGSRRCASSTPSRTLKTDVAHHLRVTGRRAQVQLAAVLDQPHHTPAVVERRDVDERVRSSQRSSGTCANDHRARSFVASLIVPFWRRRMTPRASGANSSEPSGSHDAPDAAPASSRSRTAPSAQRYLLQAAAGEERDDVAGLLPRRQLRAVGARIRSARSLSSARRHSAAVPSRRRDEDDLTFVGRDGRVERSRRRTPARLRAARAKRQRGSLDADGGGTLAKVTKRLEHARSRSPRARRSRARLPRTFATTSTASARRRPSSRCRSRSRRAPARAGRRRSCPSSPRTGSRPSARRRRR